MRNVITVFLLHFSFMACFAQPAADLANYEAKYPNSTIIIESQKLDINIEIIKNQPKIYFKDYRRAFVLADNSNLFSNSIEYFSNKFTIEKIEAYTLVPDHDKYKKIPVTDFIKTSEISDGLFYDDQFAYKYSFPAVAKGVRLVKSSEAWTNDPFIPATFFFGENKPIEEVIFTVTFPNSVDIRYFLYGEDTSAIKLSITKKNDYNIYQWKASNKKIYNTDEHSPSYEYFIPHVIVQIAGYWAGGKYNHVLGSLDDYYSYCYSKISNINLQQSEDIRKITDSITSGMPNDREKVRSIFKWVQKNIKYIAIEDGENGVVPSEAKVVLQQRYGDCKDKTSILNAMILSQGLNAGFVWVGSRDIPYKYTEIPSNSVDNHMIAVWWDENNKPMLLDGTTENHRMEDIPAFIQGKQCLIAKGPASYEVYNIPVATPEQNEITDSVFIEISGDSINGKGIAGYIGEPKAIMISRFESTDTAKYKNIVTAYIPKASNKFIVNTADISDLADLDHPFRVQYSFTLPDYITTVKENTYINLNIERFLQDIIIQPNRWTPYENEYTVCHRYVCIFKIPDDYQVFNLPETTSFENPEFGFQQEYTQTNSQIILTSTITLNFLVIDKNEINQFREMLQQLNRSYLKSIVLKKK